MKKVRFRYVYVTATAPPPLRTVVMVTPKRGKCGAESQKQTDSWFSRTGTMSGLAKASTLKERKRVRTEAEEEDEGRRVASQFGGSLRCFSTSCCV